MTSPPGVMHDTAGVTILDTREIEWESSNIAAISLVKVLARDSDGDPIVVMRTLARRASAQKPPPPPRNRDYHPAREFYFCLAGELAHWEYEDPDGPPHHLALRERYWMDRAPGSIHGPGDPRAQVGVRGIAWMATSADPHVGLLESRALRHEVAIGGERTANPLAAINRSKPARVPGLAIERDRPLVRMLRTTELDWEPHPLLPGAQIKRLSARDDGDVTVALCWVPPGVYPVPALPHADRQAFREFSYVLDGDLALVVHADQEDAEGTVVILREGFWVDRRPGSICGCGTGDASRAGVTMLQWRLREGATYAKNADKPTVWTRHLNGAVGTRSPNADAEEWRALLARSDLP